MTDEVPKEDDARGDQAYSLLTSHFGHQSYEHIRYFGRIKRTKSTIPTTRGACLDWPWSPCPFLICPGRKKTNPTWHVTQFSHVFLLTCNMILTNHNLADVASHVNMIVSFITACSKVYVALADFFVGKPLLYDGLQL